MDQTEVRCRAIGNREKLSWDFSSRLVGRRLSGWESAYTSIADSRDHFDRSQETVEGRTNECMKGELTCGVHRSVISFSSTSKWNDDLMNSRARCCEIRIQVYWKAQFFGGVESCCYWVRSGPQVFRWLEPISSFAWLFTEPVWLHAADDQWRQNEKVYE